MKKDKKKDKPANKTPELSKAKKAKGEEEEAGDED